MSINSKSTSYFAKADSINVSVIIPVYNNQIFIYDCLQSVINQSLKNIEIICVNDGSTDLTLSILNDFSKKDSRIIVLNQNNNGPGFSRNRAARIAKGKYLYFMDSDDTIDIDCLERLFLVSEKFNSDICLVGVNAYDEINKSYVPYLNFSTKKYKKDTLIKKKDLRRELFFKFAPFFLFYKKEFFINNKLCFNEKYLLGEDVLCSLRAKIESNIFAVCNADLYHYRINTTSSITSNINNKKIDDLFSYFIDMHNYLVNKNLWSNYKKYYFDYILDAIKSYLPVSNKKYIYTKIVQFNSELRKSENEVHFSTDLNKISSELNNLSKYSYLYVKTKNIKNFCDISYTLSKSYVKIRILGKTIFVIHNTRYFFILRLFGIRLVKYSKY